MSNEEETRKLLQIRDGLERRLEKLKGEIDSIRIAIEKIDTSIVRQGFKKPLIETPIQQPEIIQDTEEGEGAFGSTIRAKDGTILGVFIVEDESITFNPREDLQFDINTPPLQSFLVERVLRNMKKRDEEGAANGIIEPEKILNYQIDVEEDRLKSIKIDNYGGDNRQREIRSSIRWTFDKMYEKGLRS
jgi:hypothetical protein